MTITLHEGEGWWSEQVRDGGVSRWGWWDEQVWDNEVSRWERWDEQVRIVG